MGPLPTVFVAFMALYMVPFALGLECYACSNPDISGEPKCDSDKAEKITCQPFFNRCLTFKYTISLEPLGSKSIEQRNCSINTACDPNPQFNRCKMANLSGLLTDCSLDCCDSDLCNKIPEATTKPQPTSDAFGLVASFGAILFVFVFNMFA